MLAHNLFKNDPSTTNSQQGFTAMRQNSVLFNRDNPSSSSSLQDTTANSVIPQKNILNNFSWISETIDPLTPTFPKSYDSSPVLNPIANPSIVTQKSIESSEQGYSSKDRQLMEMCVSREMSELTGLKITSMSTSIYSKEQLMREAVVKIDRDSSYGYGSVNDPRMGTTERTKVCNTCSISICSGHMGYISLATPVYHPFFIKNVAHILTCLCPSCGALLVTHEEIVAENINHLSGATRLQKMAEFCAKSQAGCNNNKCKPVPRIYTANDKEDTVSFVEKFNRKNKRKKEISPEDALKIFYCVEGQRPEDIELLGFKQDSKPSDLIMQLFPVIPPISRPPADVQGNVRQDNLTKVYTTLVRLNNSLQAELSSARPNKTKIIESVNTLKFFVKHIFQNSDGKMKQPQPLECLTSRIKGKKGVIRFNIMGKRSGYTARSVANPDPGLDFGQVLVPSKMAQTLTYPEKVANFNREHLQLLFNDGRITKIIPIHGPRGDLGFRVDGWMLSVYQLQIGDIVHRWLQNGDYAIVNRQPTLHRQGMIANKVKLTDDENTKVIGLHLSITKALNADFDGDELNLHIPQTIEQVAECDTLASVRSCVLNEATNKPITGLVFDNLIAVNRLTRDYSMVTPDQFYDLMNESYKNSGGYYQGYDFEKMFAIHRAKMQRYKIPLFSGYSVFSIVLPEGFHYKRGNPTDPDSINITNGVLTKGNLSECDVGTSNRSIVQALHQWSGNQDVPADFINRSSRMLNRYIMYYPGSIGLTDCLPTDQEDHEIFRKNELLLLKRDIICNGAKPDDIIEEQRREMKIISLIRSTENKLDKSVFDKLDPLNGFMESIASGAKGSKFNIRQIMSMLGQQFFYGQRPNFRMSYYRTDDLDPEARGFVQNSFLEGLNPGQMFWHAGSSRIGVLDTATKVSLTGCTQRRLVKFFESVVYMLDGTVTNAGKQIIQFLYGDDGFNSAEMVKHNGRGGSITTFLDIANITDELNNNYGYPL